MTDVVANLAAIKSRINQYEIKYHRPPGSVRLLAVSKTQPLEKVIAAIKAGQLCFGENRLQEALPKIAALTDQTIEWHFIGAIQSNKTRKIAEHFAWVHSVADPKIAQRLNEQRPDALPPLNICLEINVSNEASKSGIPIDDALKLAALCQQLPKLRLRGLMAVPAPNPEFNAQRQAFHTLFELRQLLCQNGYALDTLSMGMTDDFEAAIAEGSTIVRIGTAIFGIR